MNNITRRNLFGFFPVPLLGMNFSAKSTTTSNQNILSPEEQLIFDVLKPISGIVGIFPPSFLHTQIHKNASYDMAIVSFVYTIVDERKRYRSTADGLAIVAAPSIDIAVPRKTEKYQINLQKIGHSLGYEWRESALIIPAKDFISREAGKD